MIKIFGGEASSVTILAFADINTYHESTACSAKIVGLWNRFISARFTEASKAVHGAIGNMGISAGTGQRSPYLAY